MTFDTQSKPGVRHVPSTDGRLKLARALQQELITLGFNQVTLSEHGCVMATLASNVAWQVPSISFISYMDTSPDYSGKNVNPQILEDYRGGDIALGIRDEILSPVMFTVLHQLLGNTLITRDGKTLLGADDKAGIAEIITAMVRLKHQQTPHGTSRSRQMKKLVKARNSLMLLLLARSGLIPSMAVVWANSSLKTSMRHPLASKLWVITFTPAVPKG